MELVILTFVLVLGIIGGSYWALVLRPEQAEEAALHGRIKKAAVTGNLTKALLKEPGRLSDVGVFDRLLVRSGQAITPLQRMLDQSGLKITVGTLLLGSLVSAAVGFFIVYRLVEPAAGSPVHRDGFWQLCRSPTSATCETSGC